MNLRDPEFPDRRGARRKAAPRSSRPARAPVPSDCGQEHLPEMAAVALADAPRNASSPPMQVLNGQAVSAGIAIGPVMVLDSRRPPFTTRAFDRELRQSPLS